jgi:hypothetical protein
MNHYLIVSFLQQDFPLEFLQSDWPLHVTIVRPFFSNHSEEEFVHVLSTICAQTKPLPTAGKSRELFGPNRDIPVTELENTPALQLLHEEIMSVCGAWMEFKTPQYHTYRPHATDQTAGSVSVGEAVVIRSISLIESRGDKRRVVHTTTL